MWNTCVPTTITAPHLYSLSANLDRLLHRQACESHRGLPGSGGGGQLPASEPHRGPDGRHLDRHEDRRGDLLRSARRPEGETHTTNRQHKHAGARNKRSSARLIGSPAQYGQYNRPAVRSWFFVAAIEQEPSVYPSVWLQIPISNLNDVKLSNPPSPVDHPHICTTAILACNRKVS